PRQLRLLLSQWRSSRALAAEGNKACVQIDNKTPGPLLDVKVIHKYSSVYNEHHKWDVVPVGLTKNPKDMEINFNTGIGRIGLDRWKVTWRTPNETLINFSDPDNYRSFFDTAEHVMASVAIFASYAVALGSGIIVGLPAGPLGAAAGALAGDSLGETVSKHLSQAILSSETTAGFKEHMLEEEDVGGCTVIIIDSDHSITLSSRSGNSTTKVSQMKYKVFTDHVQLIIRDNVTAQAEQDLVKPTEVSPIQEVRAGKGNFQEES
ncbi:hypothetical protein QQS21_012132, partial [Conoideocrella luteorostrata]